MGSLEHFMTNALIAVVAVVSGLIVSKRGHVGIINGLFVNKKYINMRKVVRYYAILFFCCAPLILLIGVLGFFYTPTEVTKYGWCILSALLLIAITIVNLAKPFRM